MFQEPLEEDSVIQTADSITDFMLTRIQDRMKNEIQSRRAKKRHAKEAPRIYVKNRLILMRHFAGVSQTEMGRETVNRIIKRMKEELREEGKRA